VPSPPDAYLERAYHHDLRLRSSTSQKPRSVHREDLFQ
jgi:hypothetical protein